MKFSYLDKNDLQDKAKQNKTKKKPHKTYFIVTLIQNLKYEIGGGSPYTVVS